MSCELSPIAPLPPDRAINQALHAVAEGHIRLHECIILAEQQMLDKAPTLSVTDAVKCAAQLTHLEEVGRKMAAA